MKNALPFLFFWIALSCQSNTQKPLNSIDKSIDKSIDSAQAIVSSDTLKQIAYNNPVMLPNGASLVNLLKAYYNTGQFQKIKPFLILRNNSKKTFESSIETIDWAYKITLKNCEWVTKNKFKLTYTSTINNTPHLEQYYGEIINDTAKLYYNCLFENPFEKQ